MKSDLANKTLAPLFEVLPFEAAMATLIVKQPASDPVVEFVRSMVAQTADPGVQIGLWLYADCFEEAHSLAQALETPIGSFWHGILHRKEGDFWNSKYWLRRARTIHLVLEGNQDYYPDDFVDAVEKAQGENPEALVATQRAEWLALISYCLENSVERS